MKNVLALYSSLNGDASRSSQLVNQYLEILSGHEQIKVVRRDVGSNPIEHLSGEEFAAWLTPEAERSEQQSELARLSDDLVAELQAADQLIIGVPMYNFGIPSTLKAWIDRIARAGKTFKYTENGPVGLLADKEVIIMAARGGQYQGTPKDSQTQYLKDVFAFVGLTDVSFVYAEGLNMAGGEERLAESNEQIQKMLDAAVIN